MVRDHGEFKFDPRALADAVEEAGGSAEDSQAFRESLKNAGRARVREFAFEAHVDGRPLECLEAVGAHGDGGVHLTFTWPVGGPAPWLAVTEAGAPVMTVYLMDHRGEPAGLFVVEWSEARLNDWGLFYGGSDLARFTVVLSGCRVRV